MANENGVTWLVLECVKALREAKSSVLGEIISEFESHAMGAQDRGPSDTRLKRAQDYRSELRKALISVREEEPTYLGWNAALLQLDLIQDKADRQT